MFSPVGMLIPLVECLILAGLAGLLRARGLRFGLRVPSLGLAVRAIVLGLSLALLTWGLISIGFVAAHEAGVQALAMWFIPDSREALVAFGPPTLRLFAPLVLSSGLVAPLLEELVFRRIVFACMRRWWGFGRSMLASSALFAVPHGSGALGALVLGVAACLLYERDRNLSVPTLMHAANNLMSLALASVLSWTVAGDIDLLRATYLRWWFLGGPCVLVGALGLIWAATARRGEVSRVG